VIERVLGEGGMGRVYRASDTMLLRRVALKILSSDLNTAEGVANSEAILREARVVAALNHENVIAVYDVGEAEGSPYIAMEYISGESLREKIGDTSISTSTKIAWLKQIARGLIAAHDKGLVHRDIKPENILIRKDGIAKVLDFGIAHKQAVLAAGDASTVPLEMLSALPEGTNMGTPRYMSPEQIRGEAVGAPADQFAWGLVAYELLSGQHPFRADEMVALMGQILGDTPPPLSPPNDLPSHVPPVVQRAISKVPADRYPSMRELLLQLSGERESQASLADASGAAPSQESSRPVFGRAALVGALVFASLAALLVTLAMRTNPKNDREEEAGLAVAASDAGIPITALALPQSANLSALLEYKAGLQAARDGAGSAARDHFTRATQLDPTMAQGHLMLAAITEFQDRAASRSAMDRASELRGALVGRDHLLFESLEPVVMREPADVEAAIAILEKGISHFPKDAHLRLQLAIYRSSIGQKEALADATQALALDPEYGAARLIQGLAFETLGEEEKALETYNQCLALLPRSGSCFAGRAKILSHRGQCAEAVAAGKAWTSALPSDADGFRQLAILSSWEESAGAGEGLDYLLTRSRNLLPERSRKRREQIDNLRRALLQGALVEARSLASTLANDAMASGSVSDSGEAALALVEISNELGEKAVAVSTAKSFVEKQALWGQATRMDQDPTLLFVRAVSRAGEWTQSEIEKRHSEWAARWGGRGRPGERWIANASGVETRSEAEEVLSQLPAHQPLPPFLSSRAATTLGNVYLLSGQPAEAVKYLERAVAECGVLRDPISFVHAARLLGDAYLASGDTAQACTAYRRVLKRWSPKSTLKSETLALVRRGMVAASCKPAD